MSSTISQDIIQMKTFFAGRFPSAFASRLVRCGSRRLEIRRYANILVQNSGVFRVHKFHFALTVTFVLLVSFANAPAQKIKVVADPDSAKILTVKNAGSDLPSGDLADKVETDGSGKSTLTISADKHYEASVFCIPSRSAEVPNCVARVFILDLQTDENYEIFGEEPGVEAGRPVDSLKWVDNHTLSYDRWMNPHIGHRYVVDLKTMKQTAAFIVTDR